MIEPPYGIIWDTLNDGNVIPFLGAGGSLAGRRGARWDALNPTCLPSGVELSELLADKANFPSTDPRDREDLAKVSSYFADAAGRLRLRRQLRQVLNHPFQPGVLHEFLASVAGCHLFVSTNYDILLEQAFRSAGRPYDLVIYPSDEKENANSVLWWRHGEPEPIHIEANLLQLNLEKTTVIYKMHGSVVPQADQWDSYVITEEDYVEFLSRLRTAVPAMFVRYSLSRSFLFLGYSLRDWNLRVVLRNLRKQVRDREEGLTSWAIQWKPSPLEIKLWERRNVDIFDVDLEEFVQKLKQQTKTERAAN